MHLRFLIAFRQDGVQTCSHGFKFFFIFLLILLCGEFELCPGPNNNKRIHIAHIAHIERGLFTKKDAIADFLYQRNVSIFGINETLLTTTLLSSFVFVDGYSFERRDRRQRRR